MDISQQDIAATPPSASIRLSFLTDTNETVHLSIRNSRLNATSELVDNSMDDIIASTVYNTNGRGTLAGKIAASFTTVDVLNFAV